MLVQDRARNVALVWSAKDVSHMLYATCAVKGNVVLDVSYAAHVYSKSFFRVSWRIWDTWPKSCNVHLDASAFKTELLNKSLHLEMEDMGDMTKILKCTPGLLSLQNHDKNELLKKKCMWKWRVCDTWPKS